MNKTLKKIIIFALAVVMLVSFVGCGENGGETTEDPQETVDKNTKKIAFTFDDGPHAPEEDLDTGIYPYTEYLLDRIETLGAKVTFFVLGDRAELYSGTIKRAVSLGCEIGSHSYSHPSPFDELSVSEFNSQINKAETAIEAAAGYKPTLFRPVGGAITEEQLASLAERGYTSVAWSIDTNDWDGSKSYYYAETHPEEFNAFVDVKVDLILSQAYDGSIILMHDKSMSSVEIFDRAAKRLIEEGYELVTVSEILGDVTKTPTARIYTDKDNYQTSRK
ncbi:MAG: polysaccharide deacetylase family protein [Clostridia bacterium]|nr:polysaccharide deacetylase family protein [Clostridia bacterium]